MSDVICPYKKNYGKSCAHIYAERVSNQWKCKTKTICRYADPEECQLFKLWKKEIEKEVKKK